MYIPKESPEYKDILNAGVGMASASTSASVPTSAPPGIPLKELADGLVSRKEHVPLEVKKYVWFGNKMSGAMSLMWLYRMGFRKTSKDGEGGRQEGE